MRLSLHQRHCLHCLSRVCHTRQAALREGITGFEGRPASASQSRLDCGATASQSLLDKPAEEALLSRASALPISHIHEADDLVSMTDSGSQDKSPTDHPNFKDKVVIGIDPDNNGAVAMVRVQCDSRSLMEKMSTAHIEVHDMPLEEVQLHKRVRRQADCFEAVNIIRGILDKHSDSAEVSAVLEQPIPNPINGSLSFLVTGVGFGVWKGVLASHDVGLQTTSARRWKGDLGLNKAGKEGSISLATQIFPQARPLLKRKKDHGRAEALLIAAWALGLRALKIASKDGLENAETLTSGENPKENHSGVSEGLPANDLTDKGILSRSIMLSDTVQRHYIAAEGCIKMPIRSSFNLVV